MILIRNQENLRMSMYMLLVWKTIKNNDDLFIEPMVKEMKGFIISIVILFIIDFLQFTVKDFSRIGSG